MKRYSYKALAPSGDVMAGTSEAENEADLRRQIEARGLIAVEMKLDSGLDTASSLNWRQLFSAKAETVCLSVRVAQHLTCSRYLRHITDGIPHTHLRYQRR